MGVFVYRNTDYAIRLQISCIIMNNVFSQDILRRNVSCKTVIHANSFQAEHICNNVGLVIEVIIIPVLCALSKSLFIIFDLKTFISWF